MKGWGVWTEMTFPHSRAPTLFDSLLDNTIALSMPPGCLCPLSAGVFCAEFSWSPKHQILRAQVPRWVLVLGRHRTSVLNSHPANIPGECHPLACPLLLGACAAAAQGVPSHDAWEQDEGRRALSEGRGSEERGLVPQNQG